ncbi:MAG: magnesium transporter [Verrucomicrobiales bacterium]|jgi:magnesium transporter
MPEVIEPPSPPPEEGEEAADRPWEQLSEQLASSDAEGINETLGELSVEDQRRAFGRLSQEEQVAVVESLDAEAAADILERLPEAQASDILGDMTPSAAAEVVHELPAEVSADLLQDMPEDESTAVLENLSDPEEAESLRELASYPDESAGGLMSPLFAAFKLDQTLGEVLKELNARAEDLDDVDVQYVYAVDDDGALAGVLPLRNIVLRRRNRTVAEVMIADPVSVCVTDDLEALEKIFDSKKFLGLPVVDPESRVLRGIVSRSAVSEARAEHQSSDFTKAAGIVGGEELRSLPMRVRCVRRLSWLAPNIILNIVAASVIAMYQDTLEAVIALAVFLPIVSDMSGCSGNQAVAVSMRELTLGVIRLADYLRVIWKEGILGIINGIVLGLLLGTVAGLWQANVFLGLVVGSALAMNTVLSVLLGGLVPLAMKRMKIDPALASGPILTTCTDMCGFFLVLNLATLVLSHLT